MKIKMKNKQVPPVPSVPQKKQKSIKLIFPKKISPEAFIDTLLTIEIFLESNFKLYPNELWIKEAKEDISNLINHLQDEL